MTLTGHLRTMRCELRYLHRADGSCSYYQGKTFIWASCFGPGDIHIARREDEQLHLDVTFRHLSGDSQHHWMNSLIQTTLESLLDFKMFPRTGLTITAQLLQSDGSVEATALNAVGLAVLDNGIPIRAPFCGVEVCELDGKLVLDADARAEAKAEAKWIFVFTRSAKGDVEMIASDSVGPFNITKFVSAVSLAGEGAKQIFSFYREMMESKHSVDILPQAL